MHACRQEAIEDLKQGALKEETEETKDERKLRKPKVECSVFKRELHSEESEDAEEGPASPEEDSAPDAATQVVQSRGSSLFQDDGSSDNDLFKNRFCRKSLRVKSEAADADRWASLPKTLKKDIVGAFDEAVLQSVPDDLSACLAGTSVLQHVLLLRYAAILRFPGVTSTSSCKCFYVSR